MRLLYWDGEGEPYLVEAHSNIPPYAILSHTWGEGEVTFKHYQDGTAGDQAGYRKILFCAEQARRDNISYFWIDTCCIDKASSAELTENINCMYEYYQNAVHCYAYLADVTCPDVSKIGKWQEAFQMSRWFTRGWTLQELLAPANVEFFSDTGVLLGDKKSLDTLISKITRIPVEVLHKTKPLAEIEPNTVFRWMEGRNTMRPEDQSYAIVGILDVHMAVIYGEGGENARIRLKDTLARVAERSRVYSTFVGGVSGASFTLLAPLGENVHELHLWSSKSHIQAVRVKYTNGKEELAGQASGNSKHTCFVFNQNERIKQLLLWDNQDNHHLGGIGFTTTDNRSIEFGNDTMEKVEWKNKLSKRLIGISGLSGRDINRLAFVFSW
ncbi:beta transducin-like protein het-e4s [Grosmannia clavigera kw1407]|uniref:Beta transducin-like protein het-e4s n=1 Tax=Grosmannia clavigera (strain kw1407 / UAMH 11150) TaxID=655863 RepID=F0XCE2_GROCL|nr:beta transducin-like protein het-e4s [Grosmannia clavigera kw1407]EFX04051.1 beta transducin-like protein het-e4s [Grosmannia clavigera kw1407]